MKRQAAALTAAVVTATPAVAAHAHDLTPAQKRVYKHRWQLSTYKVAWYTGRGRWTLRPRVERCRELRFAKPRGRCFRHRQNLRWHRARVARIGRLLWPPPSPAPAVSVDGCLGKLIDLEGSGGNPTATNPATGAYGIPQALPGSKMASAGSDWATNPATQIRWMIGYVNDRYGGSCAALSAWYRQGGWY